MDRHEQLHGQAIQDSGLNQHAPFPVAGLPGLQSLEPPSVLEMMEHRAAPHDADTQNLLIENQQLLEGHQTLRQDLDNTEKEIRKIQGKLGDVKAVSGLQMSELAEKIRKMEAEICAGAAVKKELLEVHLEADKLRAEKHELSVKLQKLTKELERVEKWCDGKTCSPVLHAELDGLQKEYQSVRAVLQYSQDINIKQVEQMKTMEISLKAMTEQVGKLRVEVQDAEMRAQEWATVAEALAGTGPYGSAHINLPASYQQATQEAGQSGVAQAPAASAVIYPDASLYAYFPAVSYQQETQGWLYTYAVPYADTNPVVYHLAMQASGYAGYPAAGYDQNVILYDPGYPADYDQNALYYYPIAYDALQYTVTVADVPATDAASMDGNAGFPSGQVQADGGTTTGVAEAPEPPSDVVYLVVLTPTGDAPV